MGQTIIKVVQLQALREQRAEDVERASERGQNHTGVRPSPSRSPRPPWPGQRWRDARREPPGPSGSCSSTGRHPTRSRGRGGRRRARQSGGHRRLSNENVDDEILCAVVLAARGVKGIQNKNKIGTSGARGWTCPESLPQGLGCPDPGDLWIASPKVVLFSISNVSCQKFIHVSVCSFVD